MRYMAMYVWDRFTISLVLMYSRHNLGTHGAWGWGQGAKSG